MRRLTAPIARVIPLWRDRAALVPVDQSLVVVRGLPRDRRVGQVLTIEEAAPGLWRVASSPSSSSDHGASHG